MSWLAKDSRVYQCCEGGHVGVDMHLVDDCRHLYALWQQCGHVEFLILLCNKCSSSSQRDKVAAVDFILAALAYLHLS